MKNNFKIFIVVMLLIGVFFETSSFAQQYNLQQAIDKAVEKNPTLRKLESQIPTLNEQLRKAKSTTNKVENLYTSYKRYMWMYNDSDKPYEKLKNMSPRQLARRQIELSKQIQLLMMRGKFDRADDLSYQVKFIVYAQMFGIDEPKLTKYEIYKNYINSIEMITPMVKKERDKILNNKEVIIAGISVQTTKMYLNILNLEEMIKLEKEMLALRNNILNQMQEFYAQGLISKNDLWEAEQQVSVLKNNMSNHKMQLDSLKNNFNNILGQEIKEYNNFYDISVDEKDIVSNSIKNYTELAQKNNSLLKGYNLDLEYAKKNLELYKKYDGVEAGEKYEDMIFAVDSLEKNIRSKKGEIEKNLKFAYEQLIISKLEQEFAKNAFDIATEKFNQDKMKNELGIIKAIELNKSSIERMNKNIEFKRAKRNLKEKQVMFECLVKYGQI